MAYVLWDGEKLGQVIEKPNWYKPARTYNRIVCLEPYPIRLLEVIETEEDWEDF